MSVVLIVLLAFAAWVVLGGAATLLWIGLRSRGLQPIDLESGGSHLRGTE